MEFDIVVYHEWCSDGTAAAWVVNEYHKMRSLCDVTSDINLQKIGCKAGVDIDVSKIDITGKRIIYVDIAPTADFVRKYSHVTKKMFVLDHHISSHRALLEVEGCENFSFEFDQTRSGCMLAWDYFFKDPDISMFVRPWFIDYIGDRDLWAHALPFTKEINEGMHVSKMLNFEGFDAFLKGAKTKDEMKAVGEQSLIEKNKIIEREVGRATECEFVCKNGETYRIFAFKGPDEYRSDIGNAVLQRLCRDETKPAFSVNYRFDLERNMHYLSLRGESWSPDLSEICKGYGGGGHAKASGFEISASTPLNTILKIVK